jgi:auxin efflux carrier family protein
LPIAIVSSLAYTLDSDLYWDKIDMDTAEKVVSRGILYLLIFAQYQTLFVVLNFRLGLMIRWSYGYRHLLAPENNHKFDLENTSLRRTSSRRHQTMESDENTPFIRDDDLSTDGGNGRHSRHPSSQHSDFPSEHGYSTGATSPIVATNVPFLTSNEEDITSFPAPLERRYRSCLKRVLIMAWREFLEFMNMPLWAMLVAVLIALYPRLQHYLFFEKDGFIRGSVIYAIQTCGDVSIPLILVILGANIANEDEPHSVEDSQTDPVIDSKWPWTQRQRAIILAVATRMIIVPVTFLLSKIQAYQIADYLPFDDPCCVMGCAISHGSSL